MGFILESFFLCFSLFILTKCTLTSILSFFLDGLDIWKRKSGYMVLNLILLF
ncbi:hypothetical protein C1646_696912 [Rhizophagus diaphanus]|nr:hypothetical protein C1646_696912 [Rhizophagus diaphanus] [Rhizophagus sp. MUCL 43196]